MKKKIRDADPSAFLQGLSETTNPKSRERKDLKGSEMSCIPLCFFRTGRSFGRSSEWNIFLRSFSRSLTFSARAVKWQLRKRSDVPRVPLSGGTYNRSIYLEGMRRRVQAWDPNKQSASSRHSCALQ